MVSTSTMPGTLRNCSTTTLGVGVAVAITIIARAITHAIALATTHAKRLQLV